ncbi:MAG: polymer-forming cytoskeletal protein [Phycisphaerales bacterium]|nr:polymer-forming cytoskeletal protein [Phycisphaerales bacterium]
MSNNQPAPSANTTNGPEMTVIGTDTQIKGEMFFEKSAKILGGFEGKITAQGEVQISNGANCNAAIEAQSVIVDGQVTGPIIAHGQLTLTENAQVQGDLTAGTLVVAQGASFVGHCNVGPAAQELMNNNQNSINTTQEPKNNMTNMTNMTNKTSKVDLTPPWANQTQEAQSA